MSIDLKVHGLHFKMKLPASFEESSHQRCKYKISVEIMVKPFSYTMYTKEICILQFLISYCYKRNYGYHNQALFFINIVRTEHFSCELAKSYHGYEKNVSFLMTSKSQKVWKTIVKIGLGYFISMPICCIWQHDYSDNRLSYLVASPICLEARISFF